MPRNNEIILGIDSSASPLFVAVERGSQCVSRRRKGIKQERLLFPVIHRALAACGANLQQVSKVCLVRGPGRFTGIRIGLTFASMMQYLNKAKVYGATQFVLLERQVKNSTVFKRFLAKHPQGKIAVVLHAFREEYFLQIFDGKDSQPAWLSREELVERLAAYPAPLLLAGTDKAGTSLADLTQHRYPLAAWRDCRVQAKTLLALAQDEQFAVGALEPLYLKPARFELIKPQ